MNPRRPSTAQAEGAEPGAAAAAAPDRSAVGIGWRQPHEAALLGQRPPLGFIEVHSENFFAPGGAALATLRQARALYPVSLHGVGLGLGSAVGLDRWHLDRLAALVERIEPVRVSDHACFARAAAPGAAPASVLHASDLLPIALDEPGLARLIDQVQQVQDRLKRPIGVENLSAYLRNRADTMDEAGFFNRLCRAAGCWMLLDLNNLVVNARNALRGGAEDAAVADLVHRVLVGLEPAIVGQIHLAGHAEVDGWAIDDHGSRVPPGVWAAYRVALARFGAVPTLIEWDTALPGFELLVDEAEQAARWQAAAHRPPPAAWAGGGDAGAIGSLGGGAAEAGVGGRGRGRDGEGEGEGKSGVARSAVPDPAQQAFVAALWTPHRPAASDRAEAERAMAESDAHLAHWVSVRPPPAGSAAASPGPVVAGFEPPGPALAVYRRNARAMAARALAAAHPTVAALVGDETFRLLARRHWLAAPPERGDLGEWGAAFAEALVADAQLADLPWLADVARLDWAVHAAARAADADPAALDLGLLAEPDRDAAALRLRPVPGAFLLASVWPVVSLWRAHQPADPPPGGDAPGTADAAFAAAAAALAVGQAECAWVWRPAGDWRVQVALAGPGDAAALAAVQAGGHLGEAMAAAWAVEPDWPLQAWLVQAIQGRWLAAIDAPADGPAAQARHGPALGPARWA